MDKRIGVISDTHGLLRPAVIEAFRGVDLILHAGDVGAANIVNILQGIAPTRAVRGNMDGHHLGLPETDLVQLEELSIYLLHDLARLDLEPRAAGLDAVVYGHSHHPEMRSEGGVLYFNPGSAGPRRFSLPVTVGLLHLEQGGGVRGQLLELGRSG